MDDTFPSPATPLETARRAQLSRPGILDALAQGEVDDLTRLAATALGAKSAAVTLAHGNRQGFEARSDIALAETARELAFCAHVLNRRTPFVIPDARLDLRFAANPLVAADDGIRFYAGVPLILSSGDCIGALCVFDPAPREGLLSTQAALLDELARLAVKRIETPSARKAGEIAAQVVDTTSDAVLATDCDGRIVYWNDAAERMFGRRRRDVLGQGVEIIMPSRFVAGHKAGFARAAAGGETRLVGAPIELFATQADGEEFPIELSLTPLGDSPDKRGFAAIIRDVRERKALTDERTYAETVLNTIVDNLPGMLFVKDAESRRYLRVNRAGQEMIGRPLTEIIGATDLELFPEQGLRYQQRDSQVIAAAGPKTFESQFVRNDGVVVHLRTTRTVIDGPDRPRQYILGVSEDVTEARKAESEVLRLAHYDSLTGLLNRASYTDRLQTLVQAQQPFAMLSIDLDRFKAINDQLGHLAGDEILIEAGGRLRSAVGDGGWIARVGGDEFIAVLEGDQLRERAQGVADAAITSLAAPFKTLRAVAHCGASVGVVVMPQDGRTTAQLRENVDLALYRAKQSGKGVACFFNAEMDAAARDRRTLESDLRRAIASDEVRLAYQPVISVQSGKLTSAEALARWTHPEHGPVRPDIFIAMAEECGLIDVLGEQLLNRACADAMTWPPHVRVAVNLSPQQFVSGRLLQTVQDALTRSRLTPSRLQLEVTEGLVIRDVDKTFLQLEALRALGIQVLMDDFGVGYSSLGYFERFSFDKVKIDKSFVDNMTSSKAARAIIHAVIGLGAQLNMGVVAEGVETLEQMELLTEWGCTHLQGYLFSRPVPAHHIRGLATTVLPVERHVVQVA